LIDLLHVLGLLADLEPDQERLLEDILDGPLISVDDLTAAQVLPISDEARIPPKNKPEVSNEGMLDFDL
jgi:hypothetical protein